MSNDSVSTLASDEISAADFGDVAEGPLSGAPANLSLVMEIPVRVTAELGETTVTIKDLLAFGPGSVIELERLAGESASIVVNGVLVGKGDVVVVNENYGLRITELISAEERLRQLAR